MRVRERIEFPLELLSQTVTAAGWDESEHPRHPAGTPVEGGRFAPKGEELFGSETEDFGTVLGQWAEMEKLWGDQTQQALDNADGRTSRYVDESQAAKMFVQDKIALKLKGDRDFMSLIKALDPYGDWKSEFEPGGSMETADTVEKQVAALSVATWARTSGDSDPTAMQFQLAAEEEFGLEANPYLHEEHDKWLESMATNNGMTLEYAIAHPEELSHDIFTEQQMAGARKFLRAQYDATQEMFQAYGIKSVYAYRGMNWGEVGATNGPPPEIVGSLGTAKNKFYKADEEWSAKAKADPSDENLREIGTSPRIKDYAGKDILSLHQNALSSWAHSYNSAELFASKTGLTHAVIGARIDVRRILSTPFTGYGCLDEHEMVVLGDRDMDGFVWSWQDGMQTPGMDRDFHRGWVGLQARNRKRADESQS